MIKSRHLVIRLLALLLALSANSFARNGFAQGGIPAGGTVTPDGSIYLVNKDVGTQRWTIIVNLTSSSRIESIGGAVFNTDGTTSNFVSCRVRDDSPCRSLDASTPPSCQLRLSCEGAFGCDTFAQECPKTWSGIPGADDVRLPAEFFLPGSSRGVAVQSAASDRGRASGGGGGAGATLSPDRVNYLISKPLNAQRWSVTLRVDDSSGTGVATGNVFSTAGDRARFVYCASSAGVDVPARLRQGSLIPFACKGAEACETSPQECAARWQDLAAVEVPASFFLPDRGDRDPNALRQDCVFAQPACQQGSGGARTTGTDAISGACAVGQGCFASTDTCGERSGRLVEREDGACACEISLAPPECRPCDDVGEFCSVGVGGVAATGVCQVVTADGSALCAPLEEAGAPSCGGVDQGACGGGSCCVDDARDGCEGASCPGVCAEGASGRACRGSVLGCGDGVRSSGEECDGSDLNGASCASLGLAGDTLGCTQQCRYDTSGCSTSAMCGNGIREANADEECDGRDLGGATCESLGAGEGLPTCTPQCTLSLASCRQPAFCGNGTIDPGENCDPPGVISFVPNSPRCDVRVPNIVDICCPGKCRSTTPATCTASPSADDVPQSTIDFACRFVD